MTNSMKRFLILVLIVILTLPSRGGVSVSETLKVCRNIDADITTDYLAAGIEVPLQWRDVPFVQYLKKTVDEQSISTLKAINALALVPGAPRISNEIPNYLQSGLRVYAISRTPNSDYINSASGEPVENGGRFVIVLDSERRMAQSLWIPESKAQLLLSEFPTFDPKREPLAFDEIEKVENDRKSHNAVVKAKSMEMLQDFQSKTKPPENTGNETVPANPSHAIHSKYGVKSLNKGLVAVIIIISIGGILIICRLIQRRKSS